MKKIREEVLVEIYLSYRGSTYVRGMEYTVGEKNEEIEWHEVGEDGNLSFVTDVDFYKELESTYMKNFIE